jgi:hypothetical protein
LLETKRDLQLWSVFENFAYTFSYLNGIYVENKEKEWCYMLSGNTKKKLKRILVIQSGVLLIIEPDKSSTAKNAKPGHTGIILHVIPLQSIEVLYCNVISFDPILFRLKRNQMI